MLLGQYKLLKTQPIFNAFAPPYFKDICIQKNLPFEEIFYNGAGDGVVLDCWQGGKVSFPSLRRAGLASLARCTCQNPLEPNKASPCVSLSS